MSALGSWSPANLSMAPPADASTGICPTAATHRCTTPSAPPPKHLVAPFPPPCLHDQARLPSLTTPAQTEQSP
jgi:hypothetical protein